MIPHRRRKSTTRLLRSEVGCVCGGTYFPTDTDKYNLQSVWGKGNGSCGKKEKKSKHTAQDLAQMWNERRLGRSTIHLRLFCVACLLSIMQSSEGVCSRYVAGVVLHHLFLLLSIW